MDIKYIEAAMAIADHGSDCCCSHCQSDRLILKDESISTQTRAIAKLASEPIRRKIEQEDRLALEAEKEYEIARWMTDREYTLYLSQPKIGAIPPADLIF